MKAHRRSLTIAAFLMGSVAVGGRAQSLDAHHDGALAALPQRVRSVIFADVFAL